MSTNKTILLDLCREQIDEAARRHPDKPLVLRLSRDAFKDLAMEMWENGRTMGPALLTPEGNVAEIEICEINAGCK